MATNPPEAAPAPATRLRPQRKGRRWAVAATLAAAATGAAIAFLASETALEMALGLAVGRSGGHLSIDGAAGSLLSGVRADRIAWQGPDATLTADRVALSWSPGALLSRGIVVRSVSAQRIALTLRSSDEETPLPAGLSLPTPVAIDRVSVERFEWTVGTSRGAIHGLSFGYDGGPRGHRIRDLVLALERATVRGEATLAADAPFALAGSLVVDGDAGLHDAKAEVTAAGTLSAVAVDARGGGAGARFTLHAGLSPLAAVVLREVELDVRDVDLARWDKSLPTTRIALRAEGRPEAGGLLGRVEADNALPGPLDERRVPVRSARARYTWTAGVLRLDELATTLAGGGGATGRATIPLDGGAGTWSLALAEIDLRRIYAPLAATRLSGSITADLDARRQRIEGDIADRTIAGGIGLRFAATVADDRVDIASFRARAGTGELEGSGRVDLAGERAFHLRARSARLDPAHFANVVAGSLDGEIAADGALRPAWRVTTDVRLAPGSKLAGVPVSGVAHATLAPGVARDVRVELKVASSSIAAQGGVGEADSRLSVAFTAPRLAELAPLLPTRVPRPVEGALSASALIRGDFPGGGVTIEANGEALAVGSALSFAKLAAKVAIGPANAATAPSPPAQRRVDIELTATDVVAPQGAFPRARARVDGTLGAHTITVAFAGEDLDVDATARGGIDTAHADAGIAGWRWTGTLDALENRGAWALRLAAPVALDIERARVRMGAAQFTLADGHVDIGALSWDEGRVSTRGSFTGVPVATLARLAGVRMPLVSTLTLAGDWSLAAAPRLNGSLRLVRERGDLSLPEDSLVAPADRAFRVTTLEVDAHFRDDAIEASATLRSDRGASADARVAVGVAPDAPLGHIAADAPLKLALTAELTTLRFFQPWVGTAAILDGTARLDLAGSGTTGHPVLTGTLRGDALRIDAAAYGLHFSAGRLLATLTDGTLRLDELSLTGGAGRFTASGTLANAAEARRDPESARAKIAWQAEHFRVFNRPDLRLVASGAGTLAIANRRLAIDGKLRADEGFLDYSPDTRATLGDDVVVKGKAPRGDGDKQADRSPLALNVELDLGNNLTFAGEGLRTGLRGKLVVTSVPDGPLRGRGSISAVSGSYFAFGQRLTIDRGKLIFDGPLDNPGLDIVALRKNLAVEAGVVVTGTVKVPIIQLTSNPPVPDNEKLSWLVLGRGLDRTSGSDIAALQAASAALLGRNAKPITTTIAESVGIDDISFRTATATPRGASGGTETSGQAVAFGKRITDRLSLVYEQGLTVATNALRLEYSLTRTLTLRAEAGAISGFGIYYRRTFD